jgi:alkylation response protein AidB-like acyl-CoA dehydrogenase
MVFRHVAPSQRSGHRSSSEPGVWGDDAMTTITADERAAMQDSVRRLLAQRSSEADVRRTMETEAGYDAALWSQLADMGVTGLIVDAEFGGTGGGPVELELIMEEAGAALLCGPLLSSSVLAASLIAACGDADAKARLLPGIADGSLIGTVALTGDAGTWTEEGVEVSASGFGDGWSLNGVSSFVTHAQIAGTILVVARLSDGFGIFEVAPSAAGLTMATLPTFDHTLRLARLTFDGVVARRLGTAGWEAVETMLSMGLVALAGEQAGGAKASFDMTVKYANTRIQFGRAIGSFQAIKHMAADLLLETESAISAARAAAQALADGAADARAAVSLAAFACADAFSKVTADSIQMHGGIAFTWAHPAHLYLRRARADAQLLGAPPYHRERYLEALGA